MLIFAVFFAALAAFGVFVGRGDLGHPIYNQSLTSYGWTLALNGAALGAYFAFRLSERARRH
jgi:hypothetical protein